MKAQIILLSIALALPGCSRQTDRGCDASSIFGGHRPDFEAAIAQAKTGVTPRAVRAHVGRLVLLKREGADAALKITKHTRPRLSDGAMMGAKYECYVFENEDYSRFRKYTGEVYEPAGDGKMDHVYVECGAFTVLWSTGDWIYFDESLSAIAKTDRTDIKDVDFADTQLIWHRKARAH